MPAGPRAAIEDAVAKDFVIATRAVLVGMAIALGAAFLVALARPGRPEDRPTGREADEADEPPNPPNPPPESRR